MRALIVPLLAWLLSFESVHVTDAGAPIASDLPAQTVRVPILMYHHVGGRAGRYHVPQAMFEWQMDYLAQNGFTSVSVEQIALALAGGPPLPPKPVAITFDDGWRRQLTATLPTLARNNLRATYFIIYSHAERYNGFMNFDQLRQLRDAGMWIGSHTVSHPHLPGLPAKKLMFELRASKEALEAALEQPVTTLAYPGGAYDARVMRAAQEAGYLAAVAIRGGYEQRSDQVFALRRFEVNGAWSKERFIALVETPFASPAQPDAIAQPEP
jgi:peptidoglycan/xylan/chitin deacetylase (PgdA/CDA1 family)